MPTPPVSIDAIPPIAVIGPGRAGQALGRRLAEAGVTVTGFLGRTVQGAAAAVQFVGTGRVLDLGDFADGSDAGGLSRTGAYLLAVRDGELSSVVGSIAAKVCDRVACGLWFHCSGSHDLEVLEPLRARGAGVGSLHPLCPLPDPELGYGNLVGKPGVLETRSDDPRSAEILDAIARAAGLLPVTMSGGDRLLYHAACVLAANGLTALHSIVDRLFGAALREAPGSPLGALDATSLSAALMQGALDACRAHGSLAALSGPVLRGDADLIARHRARLAAGSAAGSGAGSAAGSDAESDRSSTRVFDALMREAVAMAVRRGALDLEAQDAMRRALEADV